MAMATRTYMVTVEVPAYDADLLEVIIPSAIRSRFSGTPGTVTSITSVPSAREQPVTVSGTRAEFTEAGIASRTPVTVVTNAGLVIDVFPSGKIQVYLRNADGLLTGEAYELSTHLLAPDSLHVPVDRLG